MTAPNSPISIDFFQISRRRQVREQFMRIFFFVAALASLVISALIVISLVGEAWSFISQVPLESLWGDQWAPRFEQFDLKTLVVGSAIVTVVAIAVAGPIGLGTAVFLSEYASPRVRKVLKPVLEILAGIPSVVLGFFALTWISPNIVQKYFGGDSTFNLMAAGLGVGLLTIPLMASIAEDAMTAVPNALREASAGLGARKVTTSVKVVLPAALSGLVAALIVSVSRALGETMVVFLAAGGGGNSAQFTLNPLEQGSTLTAAMAAQASGTDNVVGASYAFQSLFFVGFLLFVTTMMLNLLADRFVRKFRQAY